MENNTYTEIKYSLKFEHGNAVPICERIYDLPSEFGKINHELLDEIIQLNTNEKRYVYFDYSSTSINEKYPLKYLKKQQIDDLFIFNTFNLDYPTTFFNNNLFSRLINLNSILQKFGYDLFNGKQNYVYEKIKHLKEVNQGFEVTASIFRNLNEESYFNSLFRGVNNKEYKDFWRTYFGPIYYLPNFQNNPYILRNFGVSADNKAWKCKYVICDFNPQKINSFNTTLLNESILITIIHELIEMQFEDTLTIILIDEDIGNNDIIKTLKYAINSYNKPYKGKVNIYWQKKHSIQMYTSVKYPEVLISREKCDIILQISALKWGSKKELVIKELMYQFGDFFNKNEGSEKFEALFNRELAQLPQKYSYLDLFYDNISKETKHYYPLGEIEKLDNYL
jgi:hypothetical protein